MTAMRATVNESLVTARGYELLREELARLRSLGRRQMSERLRQVRQDARFEDSSALSGALEEQAQLESRIAALEGRLATAQIAQPMRDGSAGVGSSVCVRHLDTDQVVEYELVGAIDPGIGDGRVSLVAPSAEHFSDVGRSSRRGDRSARRVRPRDPQRAIPAP